MQVSSKNSGQLKMLKAEYQEKDKIIERVFTYSATASLKLKCTKQTYTTNREILVAEKKKFHCTLQFDCSTVSVIDDAALPDFIF